MFFFVLPVLAGRRPLFPYMVGKGLSGSNEGENPFRLLRGSRCPLDKYFFFVLMNLNTVLFLVEKPGVGTLELIKRNTASVFVKICINGCDAKLIKRNSASFGVKMDLEGIHAC
ncbi:unnamed protein product [Musa hybrid cultivar]